ncbi:MAG TPA: saccharopine dehydrogenase C-terminal domain-containing protein [Bacteroidales bacterium]
MKKIVVLGAGMVGSAIAIDLSKNFDVTSVDINKEALDHLSRKHNIKTTQFDISQSEKLKEIIKDADLVVCAVPGFMGYKTLEAIIETGKDTVDISFMPEDTMQLDALARMHNVTVICDCGVAPGMPNVIVGYYNEIMEITHFEYCVGGLPKERKFPFEYKAPFSPVDVIEEYTRPARYVENGHLVTKPPMSDPELIYFDGIGDLEAFNTDGLRSLITTLNHIPNMKEKTLRYPKHIALIQALKAAGFFDNEPIDVKGTQVVPMDFSSKLLFKSWKLQPTDKEFTVMRIALTGIQKGESKHVVYDLFDEYDVATETSSMARTTGYTATAAVNLITNELFTDKGVFPPELIGKHKKCFDFMLNYLKERDVIYTCTED